MEYEVMLEEKMSFFTTRLVREHQVDYDERKSIGCPEDLFVFLCEYFEDKDREEFLSVMLDTANTIIGVSKISTGGLNSTCVDPKQVFKPAIIANAGAVILAHNHPSGNPHPSKKDIKITRKLMDGGDRLDIAVHDHIIIAEQSWVSIREQSNIEL